MKAVLPNVPPEILALRKRTGADRWDEMWDGVLHVPPSPNFEHQELEASLLTWLRTLWAERTGGRAAHQINIARPGGWDKDYRIPDLVLLLPDRFDINRNTHFEGGPHVVVEIQSPNDETLEKLPFYRDVGVLEVWVVQRDTRIAKIVSLAEGEIRELAPGTNGWLYSAVTGVELRTTDDGLLAIRFADDPERTLEVMPRTNARPSR